MVGTHLVVYEIISVLRLTNVRIVRQFLCGFLRKWIQTISFVYFGKIEAIRTSEDGNLKRPFYVLVELTILRRIKILKIILRDTTIADFTYFSSAWTVNNWNDETRQETGRQVLTSGGRPLIIFSGDQLLLDLIQFLVCGQFGFQNRRFGNRRRKLIRQ